MGKQLTTEEWILRALDVHTNKETGICEFDYSETEYINYNIPVKIFDKTTGEYFYQLPHVHLITGGRNYHNVTFLEFYEMFKEYFPYDYLEYSFDESTFINMRTKMRVYHKNEIIQITPRNLLQRGRKPTNNQITINLYNQLKRLTSMYDSLKKFKDDHPKEYKKIKNYKWFELTDHMYKRTI